MKKRLLLIILGVLFWLPSVSVQAWTGRVVNVVGGDLLKISHPDKGVLATMLYGVDAPEKGQPYFKKAKKFLADRVEGRIVEVQEVFTAQEIMTVLVLLDGENINELVLSTGYGWVHEKYCGEDFCSEWLALQDEARDKKSGLWQGEGQVPPWEWRKKTLTKIFRIFLWIVPPWGD